MKAITLWQPFASFMSHYLKWNETRGRATHFRGDIAICSARRIPRHYEFGGEIEDLIMRVGTLHYERTKLDGVRTPVLPFGFVLCVVEIYDCKPTADLEVTALERLVGDYSAGRFAWMTRNCRPLKTPVPVKGHQGFFNLPSDVEAKVRAQL